MPNAGTCDTGARYMLSSALDISANFMQVDIGRGMQGENNKELYILCNTFFRILDTGITGSTLLTCTVAIL